MAACNAETLTFGFPVRAHVVDRKIFMTRAALNKHEHGGIAEHVPESVSS